jgi:uncharacterized membrane protein
MQISRSKWFLPAFSVGLGMVMMAAIWIGGSLSLGLQALAVMTIFAAIALFGGRSETIRGLRGDGRDERFRQIDMHATALAGIVVLSAIILAFIVEVARGQDGTPYSWLGAIGGLSYLLAVVGLRLRG